MQAHLDETSIIAEILRSSKGSTHTMIDVGAHFGSSLAPFLNKGWKIFAFEPDKKNRQKLLDRLAKHKNSSLVKVDTSAVSNENRKGVAFFSSEESTGVSGLSAFLPSHESKQFVDTITLSEVLAGESLTTIDFLKIDTEGHDLFVLKGYPWERGKPAVIECEFEDSKTVPSGYTFHDLARYLVEKGYRVYVSEWHPIIRYGIQHDWRQLMRYPCELADPKGWGNLLAFRDPIDEQMLVTAVKKELKVASGKSEPKSEKQFYGPNLRILGMLYEFQIETGAQCTPIASNQWRYTHHDNKHNLWEASFDIATETANRIIAGCLWMQSDRQITLQASLGSNDQTDYEGTTQNITLTPGVEQCVKLSKCFDNTHKALKIKIDILDSSDGGSSVLTINGYVGMIESFAGIYERLGVDNLNITVANRLFREGDYSTALGIYISLSHQRPLTMYADNAFRSARRLGMSWVKTKEDLAMLSG
jgi:FkbM family methyltransferase